VTRDSPELQAAWALDEIDRLRNALGDHMVEFHNPQVAEHDKRCSHLFPLPGWMSRDQDDPCRCDLDAGHEGAHSCEHLRATGQ
jgi:hypothetical protein